MTSAPDEPFLRTAAAVGVGVAVGRAVVAMLLVPSLGYDAAAYRILRAEPDAASTPDIQYMLAILASRLGDEEQAVTYFLRSVELRESLKFRGNLDPEISRLIRKYGLFREDFE